MNNSKTKDEITKSQNNSFVENKPKSGEGPRMQITNELAKNVIMGDNTIEMDRISRNSSCSELGSFLLNEKEAQKYFLESEGHCLEVTLSESIYTDKNQLNNEKNRQNLINVLNNKKINSILKKN